MPLVAIFWNGRVDSWVFSPTSLFVDDHKKAEESLFRGAPESAKKLHKQAKKLIREAKRKAWWDAHATDRAKKELGR